MSTVKQIMIEHLVVMVMVLIILLVSDGAIAEVNEYREMFRSMSDIYGERVTGKKACFFCH